ncbi:MAG: DUF4837 domain-containing protein [Saprospiraceae bacterium]|nr:MAG: DUF4837 domain-containing protein [Saprospiraceae bacterium]
MKNSVIYLSMLVAMMFSLTSCSEEVQQSLQPVPLAFGKLNQVMILADDQIWEGPVGDTLDYYYGAAYPILPQPEPIFDLRQISPELLDKDPIKKQLRSFFIIANLNDTESPTTQLVLRDIGEEKARRAKEDPSYNSIVGKDKWAKGQLLIYQFAYSEDALIENLKNNFPAISKRITEADQPRIEATIYFEGENKKAESEIMEEMDVTIRVPADYNEVPLEEENLIWMRKETAELSSNLMLHQVDYLNETQLTSEGIKAIRDTLGRKYISTTIEDTYMRINDIDLPMFTSVKSINNNYTLEARGIWEIVNDYMGGAFVSYLIHNPEKKKLLFIDGFIHAPGKEKRDYMQQLEYIMATVRY